MSDDDDSEEISEDSLAQQRNEQTFRAKEVLEATREVLNNEAIELIAYLMALRLEYMEMRKVAIENYGEESVEMIENAFGTYFNESGLQITNAQEAQDIMYR